MKVRDCFSVAPQLQTRLLATRWRALGELDDYERVFRKAFPHPLTSILSPHAGRGGHKHLLLTLDVERFATP
jgi:hypothetical protein